MKGMPLPFELQRKGVDFISDSTPQLQKWKMKEDCHVGTKKTSVLDTTRSPSPPTSSSTLSSLGSGGCSGGSSTALETGNSVAVAAPEKCGIGGMEDWENVLSDFATSPTRNHHQSMLPYNMGDIDDSTMGLGKLLQSTGAPAEFDFGGSFGTLCHGVDLGSIDGVNSGSGDYLGSLNPSLHESTSGFPSNGNNGGFGTVNFGPTANNMLPISQQMHQQQYHHQQQPQHVESMDEKPQICNPQVQVNHHQSQPSVNPALFLPLSFTQQEQQQFFLPPNPKRLNTGISDPNSQIQKVSFLDSGQDLFSRRQPQHHQVFSHQLQFLPNHQHRPTMAAPTKLPKITGEEMALHQQAIIEQIFKAVELVEMGNSVHAQGILARLNHQLSPIGKPYQRVAFYFKESLNSLLNLPNSMANSSPLSLIFKIGAFKSFSEISPLVQFSNFTCNQAILESLEGFDHVHVIDFDIGYGAQWASLMQELALKNGGPPSLKITAFASPSTHDELELLLTRENLNNFANEINIPFELEIFNLELLNSVPFQVSNNEAIAVNLPIGAFSNCPLSLPMVLRFVKQLSPKIVVSIDRGCDQNDLPFAHHVIHALQYYTGLLESIDAVNMNLDALQKIERFLIHPGIEKIIMGYHRSPEKIPAWKSLFLAAGFSPLQFSNFTESQADCLIQRTPVRGFHIEKRQSSLVLCWQQKDLISAASWRC